MRNGTRDWAEEIRDENLELAEERHEAEQADLAAAEADGADAEEVEGEFYGCEDEVEMPEDPQPEMYENDLEDWGNNEAWEDAQAEMAQDYE